MQNCTRDAARACGARLAMPLAIGLITLAGCAPTRPDPNADAAAALAVGLEGVIEFRTEGAPLDEPAAGETLTLVEAVQRAATTDPGVQSALARVRIAMADADQARLLANPVLDLVLRWGPGKPQIEVSLAQDLIQALRVRRRASAADNRLRKAAAEAVTTVLDAALEVQERYANAQAADALIPLLESRRVLVGRLADTARARLEAGEGTRTDLTSLDAQRVELEVEIDTAKLQGREARLRLARLIGEPSSGAAWRLDPWSTLIADTASESRWIEVALANRPEVQAAAWELAALGDDYALAELLPLEGGGVGVDAQRGDDWFVGPSINTPIPIFDTGSAGRNRVTAQQIEARHQLTLAKRKVVEEVRVAYETLLASRTNLDRICNELIPLQERRRQVTEDVYRAERDIVPMLLAEQDLRTSQARAIEVEHQAVLALVRLERAVGGGGVAHTVGDTSPDGGAAGSTVRQDIPDAPHAAAADPSLTAIRN